MADEQVNKPKDEEEMDIQFDDGDFDVTEDEDLPVAEDAIVEVAFGDPDDGTEDIERTISWVDSFTPGLLRKQVADLYMSEGDIHVILDKMTVTIPMMELFRLLEKVDFFKGEED